MYKLQFTAYTGCNPEPDACDSKQEARELAAESIRQGRAQGITVVTLKRGASWEFLEPDDSVCIGDYFGVLAMHHVEFECRECGSYSETQTEADECCSEGWDHEPDYNDEWCDGQYFDDANDHPDIRE